MKKITITNSNEFEKIIEKIETSRRNISDIFAEESNNIEYINETDIWTGKAQNVLYRKHKELEKNFSPIDETLQIYVAFLRNTLESYKNLETKIVKDIEINSDNLNINS